MNSNNYEHYFMVRATITDGVVSFLSPVRNTY